jgi:defect-in-organelle-trafficking protein DotB
VHQRLLPRVGGGRVAIRECLEFDADLRMELLRSDPSTWTDRLHQAVQSRGLSLVESARRKRDAGVISEESFAAVMAEWGREEVAA